MRCNSGVISVLLILFLSSYPCWISSTQAQSPHGIILISLDTLRADHLGIYGYHRNTSPFIDAFAKENILFEHAVVQSPWTIPSHMSIMTSLYPFAHGVRQEKNGLADEHVTLAELLRGGGYQTAAFTDGGYLSGAWFNQGFDIYNDRGGGIAKILPRVKKWLDRNKSNPFFLFIHCFDIHNPFNPPPPYNIIFHDFNYSGHRIPNNKTLIAARDGKLRLNDEDKKHFIALYDGGIRYTDEKIGEFLTYLRDSRLENQSLIIITSDHGEEFNEHGSFGHWQLYYRPNLNVPLIMHIPNYPKKDIRFNELVQSIDLLPTILDIAGLPAHPNAQGRSLLPLIKQHKNFFNSFLWKITRLFREDTTISSAEFGSNWSVFTSDYQVINNLGTGTGAKGIGNIKLSSMQLFNLKVDPLAQNNIAEKHEDIAKRLLSQWKRLYNAEPNSHTSPVINLDKQTLKRLKALGYVDIPNVDIPKNMSNTPLDHDGDGVQTDKDNCPLNENPNQEDTDDDGIGDVCDNCPDIFNPAQEDIDEDWLGDICDSCTDTDFDGYGNPGFPNTCIEDNCPNIFNPSQEDGDGDGLGDLCDLE